MSGKPVYEHGTFHPHHFAGPGTSHELSEKHASKENADSAGHKASAASAKAHKTKKINAQGQTDPKKWSSVEHAQAADLHEEAAVRHNHSATLRDPENLETKRGYDTYGGNSRRSAHYHELRASEHRHKATIAHHMEQGNLTAAHEAAKAYQSHGSGGTAKNETLKHIERRLSKVPHNESVAKDADMEGRHTEAQKLRRMRKSETPNVTRIR